MATMEEETLLSGGRAQVQAATPFKKVSAKKL